jgi:hypothetical protein
MGFFDLFLGSFTGKSYAYERHTAKGYGLTYSFMLLALLAFLFYTLAVLLLQWVLLSPQKSAPSLAEQAITQIAEQWPEMTIREGVVDTQVPQPHLIHLDLQVGEKPTRIALLTIDTTGATTHSNFTSVLLMTQTDIMTRENNEVRIHSLKEWQSPGEPALLLNRHSINEMARAAIEGIHTHAWKFLIFIGLLFWLMLALYYYIARIILLVLLAGAGLLSAPLQKTTLDFATAMRLSALALTPITLLDAALLVFLQSPLPFFALLFLGVLMLNWALHLSKQT